MWSNLQRRGGIPKKYISLQTVEELCSVFCSVFCKELRSLQTWSHYYRCILEKVYDQVNDMMDYLHLGRFKLCIIVRHGKSKGL